MKLGYSFEILMCTYEACVITNYFKSILYWVWFGAMLHLVMSYQTSSAILEKWYQTVQDVKHAGVHP